MRTSRPAPKIAAGQVPLKCSDSKLSYVPINSIFPDPRNPRAHSIDQIRRIAESMRTFGNNAPILVDRHGQIIVGQGRWEGAKLDGQTQVPIIRLEHLSDTQAKAYMLADNKLSDRSSWDDGKLALVLKELQATALDFEIETTGFDTPEIDLLIQSLDPPDVCDEADDLDPVDGPAASRPGDLWLLGDHRLFCGSALETVSYQALMGSEVAAAVFTDAPYNVRLKGHAVGKGRKSHREFPMHSLKRLACGLPPGPNQTPITAIGEPCSPGSKSTKRMNVGECGGCSLLSISNERAGTRLKISAIAL